MENFVLYDEIGKFGEITMHKGRRKGTIIFLAICCVDKSWRAKVTNHVRFVHEFQHDKIVKFLEWYETSNHLWLVMELCTGGSLQQMIDEDKHLPESVIRKFGIDIIRGLHYIHSMGVIYCDWRPTNILLDGQGNMKFFDFTLTRKIDEDLSEIFEQFLDDTISSSQVPSAPGIDPCLNYLPPEIIQGKAYSTASDFWGLGCLLYEMYCGHQAFAATNDRNLMEKIIHREPAPLKAKGSRLSGKASPAFQSLIARLLEKNVNKRITWSELLQHEFWQAELISLLEEDNELDSSRISLVKDSVHSVGSKQKTSQSHSTSSTSTTTTTTATGGRGGPVNIGYNNDADASDNSWLLNHPPRPATASANNSRPTTTSTTQANVEGDSSDSSRQQKQQQSTKRVDLQSISQIKSEPDEVSFQMHTSSRSQHCKTESIVLGGPPPLGGVVDTARATPTAAAAAATATTIQSDAIDIQQQWEGLLKRLQQNTMGQQTILMDYNKFIRSNSAAQFDQKLLPVPAYSIQKLKSFNARDLEKHVQQIFDQFKHPEKGPPSQKRLHLINYLLSSSQIREFSDQLTNHGFIRLGLQQLKDLMSQQSAPFMELRLRLCRLLSSILFHTNIVTLRRKESDLREELMTTAELLRDQFRIAKSKELLLLLVGELCCALARSTTIIIQDENNMDCLSLSISSSPITFPPSMVGTQIVRCLHRSEDINIATLACRIIESVSLALVVHRRTCLWSSNDVVSNLWSLVKHVNCDTLRSAAIGALSALTNGQINLFSHVLTGAGGGAAGGGGGGSSGIASSSSISTTTAIGATTTTGPTTTTPTSTGGAVGSLVELMLSGSQRIQENVLNLLATIVLCSHPRKVAFLDVKQLTRGLLSLLDSPGLTIASRARAYVILALILHMNTSTTQTMIDSLLLICHQSTSTPRILHLMERDLRSVHNNNIGGGSGGGGGGTTTGGGGGTTTMEINSGHETSKEILLSILTKFQALILSMLPTLCTDIVQSLDSIKGRHHPAPAVVRRLRQTLLPGFACVVDMLTPVHWRSHIVNSTFIDFMGQLLHHCCDIITGHTCLDSALGNTANQEVSSMCLCLVEILVHSSDLVKQYQNELITYVIGPLAKIAVASHLSFDSNIHINEPPLAVVNNHFLDLQMIALKLMADFMDSSCVNNAGDRGSGKNNNDDELHTIVENVILTKAVNMMKTIDTSIAFLLHIISLHLMHSNQLQCLTNIHKEQIHLLLIQYLLSEVSQAQVSPAILSPTYQEILLFLSRIITRYGDCQRLPGSMEGDNNSNSATPPIILEMIHELDLAPILVGITFNVHELSVNWEGDSMATSSALICCLDVVNVLLKYVSDVVRRALQVRRSATSNSSRPTSSRMEDRTALQAEQLLLSCRPLTDLMPLLCQLLNHDDSDISDQALRALSHLASLYGAAQTNNAQPSSSSSSSQQHQQQSDEQTINETMDGTNGTNNVLSEGNIYWIASALTKADTKRARLLLRIVKRLLVTYTASTSAASSLNQSNPYKPLLLGNWSSLENALSNITSSAQVQVDNTLKQLAMEISAIIRGGRQ